MSLFSFSLSNEASTAVPLAKDVDSKKAHRVTAKMALGIIALLAAATATGLGIAGLATHSVSWLNAIGQPGLLTMAAAPGGLALCFTVSKGIKALQKKVKYENVIFRQEVDQICKERKGDTNAFTNIYPPI